MTTSYARPLTVRHTGAVQVTQLVTPAPAPQPVPTATTQGTLALQFTEVEPVRRRPPWQVVRGHRAELEAFASRFSAVVVEVIGGDRGARQLLRWTTEAVYDDLVRRCGELSKATPGDHRRRRLRAQVRSVHLFCPSAEAAELSVHVRHGQRSRAIAARLEWRQHHWLCTALQIG